jgi:hypothetical protein
VTDRVTLQERKGFESGIYDRCRLSGVHIAINLSVPSFDRGMIQFNYTTVSSVSN